MTDYGYLGEFEVDIRETPFAEYGPAEWAFYYIERYGGIDGDHHKAWVLDQAARILLGTPVTFKQARWLSGEEEWRVLLGEPSAKYLQWVADTEAAGYAVDVGIPP